MEAYNDNIEAHIMWNFRNELEPRWSYVESWNNGWINQHLHKDDEVEIKNRLNSYFNSN